MLCRWNPGGTAALRDFYWRGATWEPGGIKEQQLGLFADRTSAATMRANQLRLYLSKLRRLQLMHALRRLLKQTPLARAQCQTIRLKLLKIGAQVRLTVRHVWTGFSMSEAYPSTARSSLPSLEDLQAIPLRC